MSKKIMHPNNKYLDINVRSAGNGKINLATGKLFFNTRWLNYADWQAGLNCVKVENAKGGAKSINTHCGKGWKLNVSKYLLECKGADNQVLYNYIDENGSYHEFTEKYYYFKDNAKQYISREKVDVDINGNLTCTVRDDTTVKIYEVFIEKKSTSGLTLETDYTKFNYGEFLEIRMQEQIELEEKVKAYISKLKEYVIVDRIEGGINFSFEHHVLKDENFTSNFKAFLDKLNKDKKENADNVLLTRLETIQYNSLLYQQTGEFENIGKTLQYEKDKQKLYVLRQELYGLQGAKTEHTIDKYKEEYNNLDEEEKAKKENEYNREIKIAALEKAITEFEASAQCNTINSQIQNIFEQADKNIEEIKKLFKQYLSLRQQLDNLNSQIPVSFITDGNIVVGFNKKGYFVAEIDAYDNQTAIIYEDDKIVAIKDSDGNEAVFEYNDDGLLNKITDYNNETTEFVYANGLLENIITKEGTATYFYTDEGDRLSQAIDYYGENVYFEYDERFRINYFHEFKNIQSISDVNVKKHGKLMLGIAITYEGERTTSVKKPYKNKITYIFDDKGNPVTFYDSFFSSDDFTNASAMEYKEDQRSYSISINLNEDNLLSECSSDSLNTSITTRQRIYNINSIPEGKTDLVFSCWAKAKSANIESSNGESDRKFELRADVFYKDGTKDTYRASFDWLNNDRQFLMLPVEVKKPLKQGDNLPTNLPVTTSCGIVLYIDYSNNINEIEVSSPSFRTGSWQYSTFDDGGRKLTDEDSELNRVTSYEYDDKDRVVKQTLTDREGNMFETTFEYNKQGKLVRSTNYSGIVNETVYDEKGREIRSIIYNKDDPTSKFYTESIIDEKGNITAEIDESGEYESKKYLYADNTSVVVKDGMDNKTAFGYKSDEFVSISGNANGEEITNNLHYTAGRITKATNGDTDYDFSYSDWCDTVKINIGGALYATKKKLTDYSRINPFSESIEYADGCKKETQFNNFDDVRILSEQVTYTGVTENKSYTYDALQNVQEVRVDINNKKSYNIEYKRNNGKIVQEKRSGKNALTKDYTYGANGELSSLTYKVAVDLANYMYAESGEELQYVYETDNTPDKRNSKVTLPFDIEQKFVYDGLGRTKKIALGKNLVKDIYYQKFGDHATNRVSTVWYGLKTERLESARYRYDKAGNIIAVYQNDFILASYEYDGLNRLIREKNFHLGEILYDYDHAGNITCKSINGKKYKYSYPNSGWRDRLVSFNGEKCEYDAIGNPTKYRGKNLAWQGRRLISYGKDNKQATYTYDFNNIRTSKTVTDGTTTITSKYIYDGNTLIAEQRNGEWIYYIYGVDGIAGFRYNNTTYLYRKNIQGDITHIYTESGKQVAHYAYDAFGNMKEFQPDNVISQINPFRYRGYYYDSETGLYYLITRYYDPETGRFISADSIEYLDPETLGGLNLYAYCNNNPVMNVDPLGTSFLVALIVGAIIAGIVSGTINTVSTAIQGGSALDCLGSFVGGFITGSVLGAATILGGGFVVGAISATTLSVLGTAAFLTVGTFVAGIGAYAAENAISGKEITLDGALKNGAITFTQGLFSFGIGAAMGAAGFFDCLKAGNGYMNAIKTTSEFFKMTVNQGGLKSIYYGLKTFYYGTMAYLGENLGPMIMRTFMKNIFTAPWNLIKP